MKWIVLLLTVLILLITVQGFPIRSHYSPETPEIAYANYSTPPNGTSGNSTSNSTGNQTQALPFLNDLTIDRPFYSPTKIIVSFPVTNNWTVGEVTTISQQTIYN